MLPKRPPRPLGLAGSLGKRGGTTIKPGLAGLLKVHHPPLRPKTKRPGPPK